MSLPTVLGSRAEAACHLLNQTLGLHRMQVITIHNADTPTRLAPPVFDGHQVQLQATFLRMIAITEAFCVDQLLELAESDFSPEENSIRTIIWGKASTSAVSSWPNIQDTYKDWYHIRPSWTRLNQLVEVRNAIAHGLGQLTRMQRTKGQSIITKIALTRIRLDDNRIVLEDSDLQNVKEACVDLISEVDSLVQTRTGDIS